MGDGGNFMKKAPWIGISTACCALLAAAMLGMMIEQFTAAWLFISWIICSALICAGELIGNAVGKRLSMNGRIRAKRYGGNIGAGIACAVLLIIMLILICIDLSQPGGGFIDLRGIVSFLALLGIGAPVLAAVIADIISAVIKHRNRKISSSSSQKKLKRLKFKTFIPPLIGLGICLLLTVIFNLFLRFDSDIEAHIMELIYTAAEIFLAVIAGIILNRFTRVNFMDNLLIALAQARSVFALIEKIQILNADTELNRSFIEKTVTANRVYIAVHIAIIAADIVWYIFKLRRDKGIKPKKLL